MKSQPERALERPLDGGGKFFLTVRAVLLIFLFYAFAGATIVLLSVWLALETVLGFVAGWFVRTVALRRAVREHFGLLKTFLRGFRLEKSIDARIRLEPEDAPELFRLIESLCIRTETALPRDVFLEMQLNAWVRLQGWRRGGAAVLGVGFDLLAGLSERELETVLAHELTHAKMTQRATRDWLARGLERAVNLSPKGANVEAQADVAADFRKSDRLCDWLDWRRFPPGGI
jgi:Zn-dependent protease with chaperone function